MGTARQTSLPDAEPVSVEEAKLVLRQESNRDDDYISGLITAAREHCEVLTNRCLARRTWTISVDAFPVCQGVHRLSKWQEIELPFPPLVSVEEVRYIDSDQQIQSLIPGTDFLVDRVNEPGRIYPLPAVGWPAAYWTPDAVEILFTAGYDSGLSGGTDDSPYSPIGETEIDLTVPQVIRTAMLQLVAHWYHNREPVAAGIITEVPLHVTQLLTSSKVSGFFGA